MRPFTRTIIELFDSKRRYLIPLYQRQYAWKVTPQLELLWVDIERIARSLMLTGELAAPHFMGAMVISQIKTFGKEVQAFEVIDGQQRLTTFQLLLAAFHNVALLHSDQYAAEITKYLLNDGVMETPSIERFKLWPSIVDRAAFVSLVASSSAGVQAESGPVPAAVAAFEFLRARITEFVCPTGEYDPFHMEKLFEALRKGLAVVSIELEAGDDPQTIFETLNSRGVDLTVGDLLRNFVFQRAVGHGQVDGTLKVDGLYEKYWLPLDGWFWKGLDTRGRLTKERLDWMIGDHLAMKKAAVVKVEDLYNSYRRWIIEESPFVDIEDELQSLTASAAICRRLAEQEDDDPIGDFGRFMKAYDVSTAVPLVIYLATEFKPDILQQALALIESYIVRRDICGLPTGNYNRFFIEAVQKLRASGKSTLEALDEAMSGGKLDSTRWPGNVEWKRSWLARQQYKSARQPRLRYLFEALENQKRTTASEIVKIKSDLTLEHIMPQKWRDNWPLPETPSPGDALTFGSTSPEIVRDGALQTLGNLTLLTQALNSTLSNGPFHTKMPAVRAQSALVLNRELHDFDKWNEDTISARGMALFETARTIWPAPSTVSPMHELDLDLSQL